MEDFIVIVIAPLLEEIQRQQKEWKEELKKQVLEFIKKEW